MDLSSSIKRQGPFPQDDKVIRNLLISCDRVGIKQDHCPKKCARNPGFVSEEPWLQEWSTRDEWRGDWGRVLQSPASVQPQPRTRWWASTTARADAPPAAVMEASNPNRSPALPRTNTASGPGKTNTHAPTRYFPMTFPFASEKF